MTHTERETLKLALNALKSAAAELYRASSYCNTYEVIGNTNDAITAIQKALAAQHEPENEPHVSLASVQEPVAWIEHHKGGDNLEWDNPGGK